MHDRSVTVSASTTAFAAAVWDRLADPYSFEEWVCGTTAICGADDSWPEPGAQLWHRFGGRIVPLNDRTTVLAAETGRRLVLAARAGPLATVHVEIIVRPTPDGADVDLCETVVAGIATWTPRLTRAVQRWRNRRSLAALIRLVEARR